MTAYKCVQLSSGFNMPMVGLGTFQITGVNRIQQVIDDAIRVGYRSIDTAEVYRNEEDIGFVLNQVLNKYNLTRGDIFLTTKLSPSSHGDPDKIINSVYTSLRALGTSYIDLYLIHWPGASRIPESASKNIELRTTTWQTLVELKNKGVIRSIGVSNYNIRHLEQLLKNCGGVRPAVNQVECHPHYRQAELIDFCKKENIHVQAYSSLGTSTNVSLIKEPRVCQIAKELDVSPARVLLKWALQQDISVIPKASQTSHIEDNFNLDFKLSDEHMTRLSDLSQKKYAWNPDNVI
ncbi:hypothetical protein HCN44_000185 [Aphidius gifuensis]|uniref:NADP-dependent oxidoreductase domain-containing protein n=1 Tax=Aphidius gifuensis TaxID=684658 RepID=A0A835CRM6_APHGI|nr:9,11-endoperoxide prostaglandin H2 reductase-like isoform X1 [Aphidius gifuensis]KAF7990380.1 hypothetical protein HCN44_000185 [Aphidius gifuensis]